MEGGNMAFPKGKKHTIETIEKMSASHMGNDSGKYNRGRKFSDEHRRKMSLSKQEEKNEMWKGSEASYSAFHIWISKHKPKTTVCENCGKKKRLEAAFKNHNANSRNMVYTRNFADWLWLCRRCHMKLDGRLDSLVKNRPSMVGNKYGKLLKGIKRSDETKMKMKLAWIRRKQKFGGNGYEKPKQ